jgi:hypothetical protein
MPNYKQFYNAWKGFTKPKRELLLEENGSLIVIEKMDPRDFLELTTDPETYQSLINKPTIKTPYKKSMAGTLSLVVELESDGFAKVKSHEGRNRSVAAIKAGVPVTVQVTVTNANVSLKQIEGFVGQLKNVNIYTDDIINNGQKLKDVPDEDADNPLDIQASRDFVGYRAKPFSIGENEKLYNYLNFRSTHDPTAKKMKMTKAQFAERLNALYTVSDDQGMDYTFAFVDNVYYHPETKEKMRTGMKWINLVPHPFEVYGSEESANLRVYTVKKK